MTGHNKGVITAMRWVIVAVMESELGEEGALEVAVVLVTAAPFRQ
jgi:hypothetical protein